jgi:hypothetical protein
MGVEHLIGAHEGHRCSRRSWQGSLSTFGRRKLTLGTRLPSSNTRLKGLRHQKTRSVTDNREEQPKMPGKGRPFPKGVSGNPGGRPKVLGDVQELARHKSPEAITTLANIMLDEKAPPAARVAAANALLDRGYGKPTQPISQTLAKVDPSSISDEELAAIAINGASVNAQAH